MPFETKWLKREEAFKLNAEFVNFLRKRKWRGPKELYHKELGL